MNLKQVCYIICFTALAHMKMCHTSMRAIQTGEFQIKLLIEPSVTVDASEKSTKALKLWRMGLITHILMANEELSLSVLQVTIFTQTNATACIEYFVLWQRRLLQSLLQ